jgi:heme A synthase
MKAYRVIAYLIAAGVLLQAAFIGYAWFEVINAVDSGTVINEDYEGNAGHIAHGVGGMMVIPLLSLVLLITSFFTKTVGASKRAGMVLGALVLQVALGFISFGVPLLGALHGINAFLVLAAALYAARLASPALVPGTPARETSTV